MALSTSRVVKVEDIEGPPEKQLIDSRVLSPDGILGRPISAGNVDFAIDDIAIQVQEPSMVEVAGPSYPVPDNWPRIPQLFRRRSCMMTNSSSNCVNKAVSHLELVQIVIEEWSKQTEEGLRSQLSTQQDTPDRRTAESRKQLRFAGSSAASKPSSLLLRKSISATSKQSNVSCESSTNSLTIQGVGGKADNTDTSGLQMPFLGADEVIDEVITLLARLDAAREEMEEAVVREKARVVTLMAKIDDISMRRLNDLPSAVQNEHEACILDLNELQWHVAYSTRNEQRIKTRTEMAEVLNKRLREDIAFVNEHIPLVQEKLELELEAMEKIRKAQLETDKELDLTLQRQSKTETKSTEANNKADAERVHIKRELDSVRTSLQKISDELRHSQATYDAHVHRINEIHIKLRDNSQELKVLEVKEENTKTAEELQTTKVKDLQQKIAEAEFTYRQLDDSNIQKQNQLAKMKSAHNHKIDELESVIKHKEHRLRKVDRKNQESTMDIQDCIEKLNDCERQKLADEKNVIRINREVMKIEQQMDITMEEYTKVQSVNCAIRDQLRSEEEKVYKMEESLKNTVDGLRRQVKDEIHTRTVLNARISSDSTDLSKSKVEAKHKQLKVTAVADEVVGAVTTVLKKVARLRSACAEKTEAMSNLSSTLEETKKKHKETRDNLQTEVSEVEPHHAHLKEDILQLDKRLDHMEWRSELMTKKMDDMDASSVMMNRAVTKTESAINQLTEELDELNIQLNTKQQLEDDLRASYNEIFCRIRDIGARHRNLIDDRNDVFKQHENDKSSELRKNKSMASAYRQLQNDFIILKDKLLNSYEEKVSRENQLKDLKKLQSLQQRMHGALLEYFKYRGLYNQSELTRMESESSNNGSKVSSLKQDLDSAIKKIAHFLKAEMNKASSHVIAMESMKRSAREGAPITSRKGTEIKAQ